MKIQRIISPMAHGNGAYVAHHLLENCISEYSVVRYNPFWTILPFLLPFAASTKGASLIHTTQDYGILFSRKTIPLVITFQNYVTDSWMRAYCSFSQNLHYMTVLRFSTRLSIQKAHALTAVSKFTAQLAKQDLKISRPIQVIYNGVDVNNFTPTYSLKSDRKELRIFFSGNLTRRKGAHWLPPIAQRLKKNIKIYYTQGLRTRNHLTSDSILKPIDYTPFDNMPSRYQQMDILLMPTVREGFSLAVLEAMACGLPVVASNCSSLPEQVDNGKGGFLCPVGDVDAFAEKINLLSDSPKLRQEMGEYNRAKVEKMFTLDRMVKEYQDLFQEVLG